MLELRIYLVEFEANERVEGRISYAGPHNVVVLARDEEHAEHLFKGHLAKKGWFLENEEGDDPHGYNITTIPRRAGVTEVS